MITGSAHDWPAARDAIVRVDEWPDGRTVTVIGRATGDGGACARTTSPPSGFGPRNQGVDAESWASGRWAVLQAQTSGCAHERELTLTYI